MHGKFIINIDGKKVVFKNNIMDQGVKKMMRVLADPTENNINLIRMSVGDSNATPTDTTLTALVNEHSDGKFVVGSWSVNALSPFDLELTVTIPDDKVGPRPYVVKELGVWFGPVGSEELFARATDATGVTLPVATAVPITYDLVVI